MNVEDKKTIGAVILILVIVILAAALLAWLLGWSGLFSVSTSG
ncbi:MAG: hypothetical protein ACFFER_14360 [Candidatus Thorarchaeota archaeon]